MRRRIPCLLLALLGLGLAPAARAACTSGDLAKFIALAQAGDQKALVTGRALLSCPVQRDQAFFWQAFLLKETGDAAQSLKLDGPVPGKGWGTREGTLARARAGQFHDLKRRVDDQEPGYANSPEALLVLARVLTRKADFAGARTAFLAYLRFVPDNDEAEAEYLYSFIWEGNFSEAEARFSAASRYAFRPPLAAAVQRGKVLIAKHQATLPPGPKRRERALAGVYKLEVNADHIQSVYQRRTVRASYEGPVDLSVAAHALDVDSLEAYKARASEARFGAHGTLGQTLFLKGHVGYFSPGDDHYTGAAAFGLAILPDLVTEAGLTREPLALKMPLVQADQDLMRDTLFYGLRYGRYVEVRLELQKEKAYAAHEYHSVLGRVPVLQGDDGGPAVALRFPASLELYPNPSPNYASDPRTVSFGAGAELHREYSSRWSLDFVLDYSMARVSSRHAGTDPETVSILSSEANVAVPLDDFWKLTAGFRYFRADDEDQVYTRNRLSGLALGLAYKEASTP